MTAPLRVACALIAENGRLFAAKRGPSRRNAGLWELPGGKVEDGETVRACIVRELREELGMAVEPIDEWDPVHHKEPGLNLLLIPVVCRRIGGALEPTEHVETGWFGPAALRKLAWSPADIPVMERWLSCCAKGG